MGHRLQRPGGSKELALAQFAQGAKYIFAFSAAGNSGIFEAAKDQGFFTSGVDTDQRSIDPAHILESVVKRTDLGVHDAVRDLAAGTFSGGVVDYGLSQNGVGPAFIVLPDSPPARSCPRTVQDQVRDLAAKIVSGEIVVPDYLAQPAPAAPPAASSAPSPGDSRPGSRTDPGPHRLLMDPSLDRRRRPRRHSSACAASRAGSTTSSRSGGVDLDLRPGEVHAVVGENGAGKTTLMRILAGVERRDRGVISVGGREVGVTRRRGGLPAGHRHGPPALHALPVADRGREPDHRPGTSTRGPLRPGRAPRRRSGVSASAYDLRVDPRRACRRPVGRATSSESRSCARCTAAPAS